MPGSMQALLDFAALVRLRRHERRRVIVVPRRREPDEATTPPEQSPALPWWFDQSLA